MKKITIAACVLLSSVGFAQQAPTPNPAADPTTGLPAVQKGQYAWFRGGNGTLNPAATNNIFGTMWNSPIYTYTNSQRRMKLNGDFNAATQYSITGYGAAEGVNTSGYLLLGQDWMTQDFNPSLFNSKGAFSMLHLSGVQNSLGGGFVQESGYRPWMQTGITLTGNNDLMYVGIRSLAPGQDLSEMGVTWSDNAAGQGPDDFVFRFTTAGNGFTTIVPNLTNTHDLDGRHIARFTATGEFGLGNTFGANDPLYVRPQSLLHMSLYQTSPVWLQMTNQTGTGQTVTDGLRIGITTTGTAHINQQENLPMIFYTGAIEDARIIPASASTLPLTNHGMMGIGNWTTAFNVANPINAKLDIDGDLRIRTVTQDNTLTQILAIDPDDHNRVHWIDGSNLGGNVTADNGIFVNAAGVVQLGVPCLNVNGNVNTTGILATQFTEDRVIANRDFNFWIGSLDTETGGVGFGGQPASTAFCNTGNTVEISANMKSTKYGNTNASGLRLTQLTSASPTLANGTNGVDNTRVLTVDQDGDVVLVDAVGGTGTVTADNGLSINPANNIQLGQACGSASSTANLLSDREIPLNDFNLIFSGQGTTGNNIGIGTTCTPIAKLQVDKTGTTTMSMSRGIYVHNSEQAANYSVGAQIYTDANSPYSRSIDVLATNSTIRNTGIHTSGWGGQDSYGINSGGGMATVRNVGVNGSAIAPGASVGWGVTGSATTSGGNTGENVGVYGSATGSLTQNFGGRFLANGSSGINYGVFAQAPNTSSTLGPHFAGYFAGDLLYTGQFGVSDQMFKKNIDSITDALSIISQLLPRTYLNDVINYSKLGFNDSKQYGFVAQEVELVLPELVGKGIHPDEYDTNGVKINSSFDFKTLNYQAFIPILTKGIQEQQLVIDSMSNTIQIQDSINNDLETRLAYLESCIRNANICEESNRTLNNELNNATNQKSIELINSNSIVLDQNMPNPFAENTVINYNIPNDVMEAKLLFYDLNGRIIKELIIEERGESKLTVYGNNLKTGVYTYSLIADGELIATKKMVKK